MAERDRADIAAAVKALSSCVKLGLDGDGPKASCVRLRDSLVHILFLEQPNGQVELYRVCDAAKAAAIVADGRIGHGGCTDRAFDREQAKMKAMMYAAKERKLQAGRRKRAHEDSTDGVPSTPPGAGELAALKAELAAVKAKLARSETDLAAERGRSAQLEAAAAHGDEGPVLRLLSKASAQLTHEAREAATHSRNVKKLLETLYGDVEAARALDGRA